MSEPTWAGLAGPRFGGAADDALYARHVLEVVKQEGDTNPLVLALLHGLVLKVQWLSLRVHETPPTAQPTQTEDPA